MKKTIVLSVLLATFMVCQISFAQDAPEMWEVSGAKNMGFKAKISFSDYSTSRIWASVRKNSSSVLGVSVRQDKTVDYKFTQKLGDLEAKVKMVENYASGDLGEVNKIFNLHMGDDIKFLGTIEISDDKYAFGYDLSGRDDDFECGYIADKANNKVAIMFGNNTSTTKDRLLSRFLAHYEFRMGDKVVAKVNSEGAGSAWIDPSLDDNMKLVLASCLTCILVQKWQIQ